ncbi:hypothetical protein J2S41_006150 [Catenuloplanes atrovinosus]|uniref:Uncharacterized protein n=1 Tax=Catenuloplanes atrovinosus TaxID=137266 RepID=A0AAE4CCL3_9ACTN|nr:hypothetical protein [Catenuloplanes atrovinosus]
MFWAPHNVDYVCIAAKVTPLPAPESGRRQTETDQGSYKPKFRARSARHADVDRLWLPGGEPERRLTEVRDQRRVRPLGRDSQRWSSAPSGLSPPLGFVAGAPGPTAAPAADQVRTGKLVGGRQRPGQPHPRPPSQTRNGKLGWSPARPEPTAPTTAQPDAKRQARLVASASRTNRTHDRPARRETLTSAGLVADAPGPTAPSAARGASASAGLRRRRGTSHPGSKAERRISGVPRDEPRAPLPGRKPERR